MINAPGAPHALLKETCDTALKYLDSLPERPVSAGGIITLRKQMPAEPIAGPSVEDMKTVAGWFDRWADDKGDEVAAELGIEDTDSLYTSLPIVAKAFAFLSERSAPSHGTPQD